MMGNLLVFLGWPTRAPIPKLSGLSHGAQQSIGGSLRTNHRYAVLPDAGDATAYTDAQVAAEALTAASVR